MYEVILVEDEEAHAELLRRAFEPRSDEFNVRHATSVSEARDLIAEMSPDLIISDLMLPDGRGIDLLPDDEDHRLPLVVMTSHGDESVAVEAMKAGALDYVVKNEATFVSMPHIAERTLREWRAVEELRQTEEELRQAQKMEAVGRLTTGVAHDFNNLLMGIIGCADIALGRVDEESPARQYVDEIKNAANRGASLTRQLLAFGRKSRSEPRPVNLNRAVAEARGLLEPLIGEDIEMQIDGHDDPVVIFCDPGQLEQVLMNLVVNARDAMPSGGAVTISTDLAETPDTLPTGLTADSYGVLTVSDTGVGIDPETMEHIFEPFFTTKDVGEGTGLGLSTVYGIVKQCDGDIRIESTPGEGTTVRIYMPALDDVEETDEPEATSGVRESVPEPEMHSILVVEDDPLVRMTVREYLESAGYHVRTARDGRRVMELLDEMKAPIDVLVADIVLPGREGPMVAADVRERFPDVEVIFMSAHLPAKLAERNHLIESFDVLQKPFTRPLLLQRVEDALSSKHTSPTDVSTPLILLAEDHEMSRMATRTLLEEAGFRVDAVAQGSEAIERAHDDPPTLLLTDFGLPDISGLELTEKIRAGDTFPPVVFISGRAPDDPDVKRALELPNSSYVGKPIEIDELVQHIRDVLSRVDA